MTRSIHFQSTIMWDTLSVANLNRSRSNFFFSSSSSSYYYFIKKKLLLLLAYLLLKLLASAIIKIYSSVCSREVLVCFLKLLLLLYGNGIHIDIQRWLLLSKILLPSR